MTDASPHHANANPQSAETSPVDQGAELLAPEATDVGLGVPIAIGAMLLFLILTGLLVSRWLLFARPQVDHAPPSDLAFLDNPTPAPHLQFDPPQDLIQLRAEEARQLSSYGWVDREKQIVRIPIEQAIAIVAEKGIPHDLGQGDSQSPPAQLQSTTPPPEDEAANFENPQTPATSGTTPAAADDTP